MNYESEITVLVKCDYETLKNILFKYGFTVKKYYNVDDYYMIDNNIDLNDYSNLELLTKCVIIRDFNEGKELLYKYKRFNPKGEIIEQSKIECPIMDINRSIRFMESINYTQLFKLKDICITFANKETELIVQLVNDRFVFIEMETQCRYINKTYKNDVEMINDINRYHLPIDTSDYYVKKAEFWLAYIQGSNK